MRHRPRVGSWWYRKRQAALRVGAKLSKPSAAITHLGELIWIEIRSHVRSALWFVRGEIAGSLWLYEPTISNRVALLFTATQQSLVLLPSAFTFFGAILCER